MIASYLAESLAIKLDTTTKLLYLAVRMLLRLVLNKTQIVVLINEAPQQGKIK